MPAESTQAAPGSEEKVLALRARAARGEQLWHPGDLTMNRVAEDLFAALLVRQRGHDTAEVLGLARLGGGDGDAVDTED